MLLQCAPEEKSALDILFLALPLLNITLPLIWKSFPFVWTADMVALLAVYYWKNAQRYLIP